MINLKGKSKKGMSFTMNLRDLGCVTKQRNRVVQVVKKTFGTLSFYQSGHGTEYGSWDIMLQLYKMLVAGVQILRSSYRRKLKLISVQRRFIIMLAALESLSY